MSEVFRKLDPWLACALVTVVVATLVSVVYLASTEGPAAAPTITVVVGFAGPTVLILLRLAQAQTEIAQQLNGKTDALLASTKALAWHDGFRAGHKAGGNGQKPPPDAPLSPGGPNGPTTGPGPALFDSRPWVDPGDFD